MRRYFGTDGIRGTVNHGLDADVALRLGMAAGQHFRRGEHRHRVVIGKDTRLSGYMIEPALVAGFTSMGMDVFLFGPIPTSGVAFLTRSLRADLGVMISASHNQFQDNGIKLFDHAGFKLSDEVEMQIEHLMDNGLKGALAAPDALGRAKRIDDSQARYIELTKSTLPKNLTLDGVKIVIDCANGAAYKVAPTALWELGAEVVTIAAEPDGFNINQNCGSTNVDALIQKVLSENANIGIALDGDADRVIIIDEKGNEIDGDQIIGLISDDWLRRGQLKGNGVVSTVMSNLGLERHLNQHGLELVRTKVGDRYVAKHMREHGFNIGGEPSGHVVLSDFATTGDGLIAALQVIAVMVELAKPISEICNVFAPVPQFMENVSYGGNDMPLNDEHIQNIIAQATTELGDEGRFVIRASGTEPLIRVMGEGDDPEKIKTLIARIASEIMQKVA